LQNLTYSQASTKKSASKTTTPMIAKEKGKTTTRQLSPARAAHLNSCTSRDFIAANTPSKTTKSFAEARLSQFQTSHQNWVNSWPTTFATTQPRIETRAT